ncbi:hypothetical protein [Dysosmobacter welbionis]|uniref:hypothetical protein n=1 Tax=Dysosmobacter welbionis TaxID=2093857 RepID=UPI00307A8217
MIGPAPGLQVRIVDLTPSARVRICASRTLARPAPPAAGITTATWSTIRGPAILVCPDRLLQPRVPVDLHDRRVPIVATETQIWRTGAAL